MPSASFSPRNNNDNDENLVDDDTTNSGDTHNEQHNRIQDQDQNRSRRRHFFFSGECYFINIVLGCLYICLALFLLILVLAGLGERRKWLAQNLPVVSQTTSKLIVNCALVSKNVSSCESDIDILESTCGSIYIQQDGQTWDTYGHLPDVSSSFKGVTDAALVIITFGGIIAVILKDFFMSVFIFIFTFEVTIPSSWRLLQVRLLHSLILVLALFFIETMFVGLFGFSILPELQKGNLLQSTQCEIVYSSIEGQPEECQYASWASTCIQDRDYIKIDDYQYHLLITIQIAITFLMLAIYRLFGRFCRCLFIDQVDPNQFDRQIARLAQMNILEWYTGTNEDQQQQAQDQNQDLVPQLQERRQRYPSPRAPLFSPQRETNQVRQRQSGRQERLQQEQVQQVELQNMPSSSTQIDNDLEVRVPMQANAHTQSVQQNVQVQQQIRRYGDALCRVSPSQILRLFFRLVVFAWFVSIAYYTIAMGIIIIANKSYFLLVVLGKCGLLGILLLFSYDPV